MIPPVLMCIAGLVLMAGAGVILALTGESARRARRVIKQTESERHLRDLRLAQLAADLEAFPGPTVDAGEFLAELESRRGA